MIGRSDEQRPRLHDVCPIRNAKVAEIYIVYGLEARPEGLRGSLSREEPPYTSLVDIVRPPHILD